MKVANIPILAVAILSLVACGSTKQAPAPTVVAGSSSVTVPPPSGGGTTTTTTTTTGQAPYSFAISQTGSGSYTTGSITTDNILKVKIVVGNSQGNQVHQASELALEILVNGRVQVPLYTSSNYTYGLKGETSQVLDFSSSITPGVPVTITVRNPKNDFYCTYWAGYDPNTGQPINSLYNSYPGCRKEVASMHTWSANLIVQTNSTTSI